jgi:hypothetical protein
MRDLKAKNVLEIADGISGDIHELHYRTPTNQERAAYRASKYKREGNTVYLMAQEANVEFALAIVEGFKAGTFGIDGEPFSSEPGSVGYREDWKELLAENAPDVLAVLGMQVFEGTRVSSGPVNIVMGGSEGQDPL